MMTTSKPENGTAPVANAAALVTQPAYPLSPAAEEWELLKRRAKAYSDSSLVPEAYRGNPANCLIVMEIAARIGCSDFAAMQNMDVINGNPGWRAKFLIGTANTCGRFTPIRYRFSGKEGSKEWGCVAVATDKASKDELVGPIVTIQMAHDEKWFEKNGSKWKTIPQLMLMYRAAAWWTRVYAPDLGLGMHTSEELEDMAPIVVPLEISPGNPKDLEAALLGVAPSSAPLIHDADGVVA